MQNYRIICKLTMKKVKKTLLSAKREEKRPIFTR